MANIGLLDVDRLQGESSFPNLALMKLSAHHKSKGDNVTLLSPQNSSISSYDKVYMSKVFTFKSDYEMGVGDLFGSTEIVKGGSGYRDHSIVLPNEIEHVCPDYDLYPKAKTPYAVGFLTRGCLRKCSFCVVPLKEGAIRPHAEVDEFLGDNKKVVLIDNNVLAHEHGLKQIQVLVDKGLLVDFNQGLDARLIDAPIAKLLAQVRWHPFVRLACDHNSQRKAVKKASTLLRQYGCKPHRFASYLLIKPNELEDALDRATFLVYNDILPYPQLYKDISQDGGHQPVFDKETKLFARFLQGYNYNNYEFLACWNRFKKKYLKEE
jgi:hypothetical protein